MVRHRTARGLKLAKVVRVNVSGLLVESDLRAHDDDPRVPVLDSRHGRERPRYATGFQARRLTVFSSFLSSADPPCGFFANPIITQVGSLHGGPYHYRHCTQDGR